MPGALSGKSAMCEISSVVYEPKGPLEPNSFFCATVTYKAAGENYFTEQTKPSAANKTAAKIIKGSKKNLVVKYTAWAQSPNEPKSADMIQYEKERQKQGNPDTSVAIGKNTTRFQNQACLKCIILRKSENIRQRPAMQEQSFQMSSESTTLTRKDFFRTRLEMVSRKRFRKQLWIRSGNLRKRHKNADSKR